MEFFLGTELVGSVNVPTRFDGGLGFTGFFGFMTDLQTPFDRILFSAEREQIGQSGEGFGLDNVSGAYVVAAPEPGALSLLAGGVLLAATLRRRGRT